MSPCLIPPEYYGRSGRRPGKPSFGTWHEHFGAVVIDPRLIDGNMPSLKPKSASGKRTLEILKTRLGIVSGQKTTGWGRNVPNPAEPTKERG